MLWKHRPYLQRLPHHSPASVAVPSWGSSRSDPDPFAEVPLPELNDRPAPGQTKTRGAITDGRTTSPRELARRHTTESERGSVFGVWRGDAESQNASQSCPRTWLSPARRQA